MMMKRPFLFVFLASLMSVGHAQDAPIKPKTFCNPINIDYAYYDRRNKPATAPGIHATADPLIVTYHGDYYLFCTDQFGYWWSHDMLNWHFVFHPFLDDAKRKQSPSDINAPMVYVYKDSLVFIPSSNSEWAWPNWTTKDPKSGKWDEMVPSFKQGDADPGALLDDDGRLYYFSGSSNVFPIRGMELDPDTFALKSPIQDMIRLHPELHGWERFGEYNDNAFLAPFIEGAWMNKHNGKYYLQYGAPGTEMSGYADGVYVSDHPLGPWTYQTHNPFSTKLGGFIRGAGHGATYQDLSGNFWHISTMSISVKDTFERRIGMWPAGFDKDDVLYCNTAYGDYPTYLPSGPNEDHIKGNFTGWMILNYNKPVKVSSTYGAYAANYAVDENIKTYWSSASDKPGEWIESDLGEISTVRAIQVNYADQDATLGDKPLGTYHAYKLYSSTNGKKWKLLIDKSANRVETMDDYVELDKPVEARYIKLVNVHVPTGKFAISGLRAFGNGHGSKPGPVKWMAVLRGVSEPRAAFLKWGPVDDAIGYVVYVGVAPDKMYTSFMVYGENTYDYRAMTKDQDYYFQIEAFNENGISARTEIQKCEVPKP
jgi:xylan 1,4-beta-xylosidase